jgi:hypothetical protein
MVGKKHLRAFWALAALAGAVLGCESTSGKLPYPDEPLLLSKKPVLGKIEDSRPTLVASAEPAAPELPTVALASAPPGLVTPSEAAVLAAKVSPPETKKETATDQPRLPALPVSEQRSRAPTPAVPAVRRRVPGTLGCAPDFSWIQGVLARLPDGRIELHWDTGTSDPRAAVLLEPNARLTQFKAGDVVHVEGDVLPEQFPPRNVSGPAMPIYRIRAIWLVQGGN